ncbi:MAG: hypothetical protein M3Q33_07080 [Acidobacteriota bacterium]|nr:hypothetical protein [Acidobacteriota bacterium]
MKLNILGKLLAVIQILIAIWYFDWQSWNQIFISILLFLSGIISLLVDKQSVFLAKLKKCLQVIAGIVVVIILVKLIFIG